MDPETKTPEPTSKSEDTPERESTEASTAEPKPTPDRVHLGRPKYYKNFKSILMAVIVLFVALMITLTAIKYFQGHNSKVATQQACSASSENSLMQQASRTLGTSQLPQLADIVTKIRHLPGYQKDANCMYMLTIYDVNSFNVKDAQADLKLFNQDYNGHNLKSSLSSYASVATLKSAVANLNQRLQQDNQNSDELSPRQPKKP